MIDKGVLKWYGKTIAPVGARPNRTLKDAGPALPILCLQWNMSSIEYRDTLEFGMDGVDEAREAIQVGMDGMEGRNAMRRVTFCIAMLLVVLAFGVSPLSAESIMVGVKGGGSFANLGGGDVYNNSITDGGTGGVFARYALTGIVGVEPEVLFVTKGAKYEAEGLKAEQKINYIEIPLLVRATLPNESRIKPSLFAGPAIGMLRLNKITNGGNIDIKDATRSIDISGVAGAGIEYLVGKGSVLIDARYEMGLTTIMKKSGGERKDVKNRVISIMVGYGMRF
jgi:hypothetical protein